MKGAGLSRRRIPPPHTSHVVSGASEILCRTSNTRWQAWHSYSYVGTKRDGTWRSPGVSRRHGVWLCLALVLVGVAACSGGSRSSLAQTQRLQARAAYERGLASLAQRQPGPALSGFKEAVALDDSVPVYHNSLGVLLLELRRPDLARESFQRALAVAPGYGDASLNLGIALAEMGRWGEAVPPYSRSLASPTLTAESVARQNLGLALYHLRQYQEAEGELRLAIALDPTMETAYYNLGLLLVTTGRRDDARAAFQHLRETSPQTPVGQAALEQLRNLGDGPRSGTLPGVGTG